jgi:outer membrane receptor protein involved in Fe transport
VSVALLDTDTAVQTNFWGEYRLSCGSAAEVNVRLVLLGYAAVVERVALTGHPTIADFELTPVDAVLDELIVRDRSPRVVEGEGGLAVGTVDLVEVRAPSTDDVLKGIPGVLILRPSGQVGSGTKVQLRGLRSLFSSNEPLIYVDGVRTSSLPSPLTGARGQSLLDLIPPSQIDRIEVFKGPAATARYGVGALPGVIHIYTKKGPVRKPN